MRCPLVTDSHGIKSIRCNHNGFRSRVAEIESASWSLVEVLSSEKEALRVEEEEDSDCETDGLPVIVDGLHAEVFLSTGAKSAGSKSEAAGDAVGVRSGFVCGETPETVGLSIDKAETVAGEAVSGEGTCSACSSELVSDSSESKLCIVLLTKERVCLLSCASSSSTDVFFEFELSIGWTFTTTCVEDGSREASMEAGLLERAFLRVSCKVSSLIMTPFSEFASQAVLLRASRNHVTIPSAPNYPRRRWPACITSLPSTLLNSGSSCSQRSS